MDKMNTLEKLNTRIRILFAGGPEDRKDATAIVQEFLEWYEYDPVTEIGRILTQQC